MTALSSPAGPLDLAPVDAPSPTIENIDAGVAGVAPRAQPEDSGTTNSVDAWLREATREYQSGWIDQPLWASCVARSGGDEAQTQVAYLRNRAMVLQLARRDKRSAKAARRVRTAGESPPPAAAHETGGAPPVPAKTTFASRWRAATVLGSMFIVAGIGFIALNRETVAEAPLIPAAGERRSDPGDRAQTRHADPVSVNATGTTQPQVEEESLQVKVAKLRDAGNWNVLVLYASEWTRKEPGNVAAWLERSVAYAALRQFDDALETATKATQLAPDNPRVWRNLGQVNVALEQPAEALHAYQQALALDDQDVQSLAQVGRLNAQLARLPQARAAFDKALSARPADSGALCRQATVARQQGRPQEADAITNKFQSLGGSCRNADESVSVAVVATRSAKRNPAPSNTR